jgi:hypothetical protein
MKDEQEEIDADQKSPQLSSPDAGAVQLRPAAPKLDKATINGNEHTPVPSPTIV